MTRPRTALVTGASRGLGQEIARQLTEQGWRVWVTARQQDQARSVAKALGPSALPLHLDVTDARSIGDAFNIVESAGPLHTLVNNAGIDYDTDQSASSADLERVRHIFETNLFGAWAVAQATAPLLGREDHSVIVNVSSGAGALTNMGRHPPGYAASKAALNALTRMLAAELNPQGTLVNAVCPGWVATDMGGGGRPVAEGAAGIVWAATLDEEGPTSGFFRDGKPIDW